LFCILGRISLKARYEYGIEDTILDELGNLFNYINNPVNGGLATGMSNENIRPDLRFDEKLRQKILSMDIINIIECIHSQ